VDANAGRRLRRRAWRAFWVLLTVAVLVALAVVWRLPPGV
jgi:paraquat-inducible protein B